MICLEIINCTHMKTHTISTHTLWLLLTILLIAGTIFAWWNVVIEFQLFFDAGYSITQFRNCTIPNPLGTACFYGAICFALSLALSTVILKDRNKARLQQILHWILIAGTLFAWSNFAWQFKKFADNGFEPTTGCTATIVNNPFETACFVGAMFFLCSLLLSMYIKKRKK